MKRIKVGKLCRKPGAAASVSQNDQRTRKAPSALNSTEEDKETATDGTSSGADYMSDTLLNTLSEDQSATTAVKRGRWDESNTKKQDEEEEDGHDYTERLLRGKSQRKSMEEFRDEGLDKQISSSNKGFKMLAKMGYKSGEGLGKEKQGRSEPVDLEIRTHRAGIGRSNQRAERKKARERQKEIMSQQMERMKEKQKLMEMKKDDFRAAMSARFNERKTEGCLRKACRTCEELDIRAGIFSGESLNTAEERSNAEPSRDSNYMWCAFPEQEIQESTTSQPEYQVSRDTNIDQPDLPAKELSPEEQQWREASAADRLRMVLEYLRSQHHYCLWCGMQYSSFEELEESCPGLYEDDH